MIEESIRKADVLIEAIPYIRAFRGKTVVVKYGGSALNDAPARQRVLEDLTFMSYVGMKPLLVHGGGPEISQRMRESGKEVRFIDGIRVTDAETVAIVEEAMMDLNGMIVKELKKAGAKAQGLNGRHEQLLLVDKLQGPHDYGFVGQIRRVNTAFLEALFEKHIVPVIAPLGVDEQGQIYNVNADQAASAIAGALNAEKFVQLTNVHGILRTPEDEHSVMSTLTESEVEELLRRKVIQGGMIPKVRAAIDALDSGVRKAHVLNAHLPHALLLEIFTVKGIGTEILQESRPRRKAARAAEMGAV